MIDRYAFLEKNTKLCEKVYGLDFDTLNLLFKKVQILYDKKLIENPISRRGLHAKFTFENQFLLTMEYLKGYPTFDVLAFSYGISKSYANKVFHKISELLLETIGLEQTRKISYKKVKKAIVDITCQPIERPQNNQKEYYNAHKKNIYQRYK